MGLKKKITKLNTKHTKKEIEHAKVSVKDIKESTKKSPPIVMIMGESPMVEQYAELCAGHGYDVYVCWNKPHENKFVFKSNKIKIVKVIPKNISVTVELTNTDLLQKRINIENISKAVSETTSILSSSITVTATEQASWIIGRHRLVGISALPAFVEKPLVEVAPTIYSPKETVEVVQRFFNSIGKEIEIVQDRIGMIMPRIICQLINDAIYAINEDVASPQDIDNIAKSGLNFPSGPIELIEKIGIQQIYSVLKALQNELPEERYRIAPLLKQISLTGEWWKR